MRRSWIFSRSDSRTGAAVFVEHRPECHLPVRGIGEDIAAGDERRLGLPEPVADRQTLRRFR